jgi:two-component sensor histidine kinase
MADVYHSIGLTYLNNKDLVNAEKNFLKSITIQSNIKDTKGLYENYNALAQLFSLKGNQKLAYLYLKKYTDYLKQNSLSVDSKTVDELTQSNSREERELLISSQEEELNRELREKEILQLQSDRQLLGIIVVVVVFILSAIIFFFVIRQRNVAQEQRETEMSQTLLRSQMNPHFIFNALAVIQSYIFENTPEKTSSFLVNFSKLIRLILENSPKEFITVDIEKEILSKYLTTQKLRFEDRFNFELIIDEDLIQKRALIPPMITQPFVENSIEHGQLHAISDGIIRIHMHERDGMLEIMVSDNGVGREKSAKIKKKSNHKSMALNITRERIQILNKKYKGKGNLEISDLDEMTKSGTKVMICLPLIYENITFDGNEKNLNH